MARHNADKITNDAEFASSALREKYSIPFRHLSDKQIDCPSSTRVAVLLNNDHVGTPREHVGSTPMCTFDTKDCILDVAGPGKICIDIDD